MRINLGQIGDACDMLNVSLRDVRVLALPARVPRWLLVLLVLVGLIVAAGFALDATIKRMGDRVAQAGYSLTPAPIAVSMAGKDLHVPANMIRFAGQRRAGAAERLDLFVHWPELDGVRNDDAEQFASSDPSVIFLTLTPPNGLRPPLARLETVYRYLFTGPSWPGPDGLVGRHLAAGSAYGREQLYYEPGSQDPFIARCLDATDTDLLPMCLVETNRDGIATVIRFNRSLLPQWRAIDGRLKALISGFRR